MKIAKVLEKISIMLAFFSIVVPIIYAICTDSLFDGTLYYENTGFYYPIGLLPRPGFYLMMIAAIGLIISERLERRQIAGMINCLLCLLCCLLAQGITVQPTAALHHIGLPILFAADLAALGGRVLQ